MLKNHWTLGKVTKRKGNVENKLQFYRKGCFLEWTSHAAKRNAPPLMHVQAMVLIVIPRIHV